MMKTEPPDKPDRPSLSDIEVTPAMLAAGLDEYLNTDRSLTAPVDLVRFVFLAMVHAKAAGDNSG